MRRTALFGQIESYVVDCAQELLAAYGHRVEPTPAITAASHEYRGLSVIGLSAARMEGTLVLLAPRDTMALLVPPELLVTGAPPGDALLRDVLGEFLNMLSGRVANRLLAHGLEPLATPPTTLFGEDLVPPAPASGTSAWHGFAGGGLRLLVRLDLTFEEGFDLPEASHDQAPKLGEGDLILFDGGTFE